MAGRVHDVVRFRPCIVLEVRHLLLELSTPPPRIPSAEAALSRNVGIVSQFLRGELVSHDKNRKNELLEKSPLQLDTRGLMRSLLHGCTVLK